MTAAVAAAPKEDSDSRRWRVLALLAAAQLLGMSPWFAASAVAPELAARWGLDAAQTGWLTSGVQLGFVAGTLAAAVLNLADVIPSRWFLAGAAASAALANGLLPMAGGFHIAVLLRGLTGFCLAGVYPPALKMAATWFRSGRGLAIGAVVGALTVGKAGPYLAEGLGLTGLGPVVATTSGAALLAAIVVAAGYRDGPYAFPPRPFAWRRAAEVVRSPAVRLVTAGYLGHMWELYAFWTWIPAFLAASEAARTGGSSVPTSASLLVAFLVIAVGALGCLWGGWVADRLGRERLVIGALAASGACSLLVGAVFGAPLVVVAAVALVWGFFVIADSAQFSALVTETAPPHAVGTALTLQTSVGFLLTIATIQLVPVAANAFGWRWAFPVLAAGPAAGMAAMGRLRRLRSAG